MASYKTLSGRNREQIKGCQHRSMFEAVNESCEVPEVPRSTKKYQEVPRSTEKYQEVPRSTKKYQEVPRSTKKYQEVPRSTKKYQEVPRSTKKSKKSRSPLFPLAISAIKSRFMSSIAIVLGKDSVF